MKRLEITVNGVAYPCGLTMGAMLRFREQTGRDVSQIDPTNFTDLCTYLWCCVVSASNRENKSFDMSLMDFADALTLEDMETWGAALMADAPAGTAGDGEGEKKSPQASANS